ncbi:MAG TPA: UDP-N-acetylmuramoyl-tripeptide--D-alanyl-D-alanine ligase [Cytophagales bacterium]|nr:UDP-N-acetylmuramoyl-tripeptide--D-alanyl-D-alanine ligase [Cytophagales bacterium]
MNIPDLYKKYLECEAVSTDTRKILPRCLFVALKGGNFNGNQFAEQALNSGAKYALVDEKEFAKDERYLLVEDCLTALQKIANHHRRQLNIPFIAITGSNGKTTTKELVSAVLSKKYKTLATVGNLNNHIGVPLTLLSIKKDIEIAVIEMGANHQQEIKMLCEIAEPTHGLITNIGKAHLAGFGGPEGVKKGKGELYDFLYQNSGTVFVNTRSEILKEIASKFADPVLYPGENEFSHTEFISASPFIKYQDEAGNEITTQLLGSYNFDNIATALCVGKFFDVPLEKANDAVSNYNPSNNRSQIIEKRTNKIILDAYNANPSSMKVAIENLMSIDAPRKAVVLGDMFELGEEAVEEHKKVGELLNASNFDLVILTGKLMAEALENIPRAYYFPDQFSLRNWLTDHEIEGHYILIKGSRGMGLEVLVDFI